MTSPSVTKHKTKWRPPLLSSLLVGVEGLIMAVTILMVCGSDLPRFLACSFGAAVLLYWEGWYLSTLQRNRSANDN